MWVATILALLRLIARAGSRRTLVNKAGCLEDGRARGSEASEV